MELQQIDVGEGSQLRRIAIRHRAGSGPGLVWLGGYRSDMAGTKAIALDEYCAGQGIACCRHDYSGHGESGGEFADGSISLWLEESLAVFEKITQGPQILVGSSMGAWIALRMARELYAAGRQDRLHAMLLLAPAPDFTQELMWPRLTLAERSRIEAGETLTEPSQYAPEPNIYTAELFRDGLRNRVLSSPMPFDCPIHILQGMQDPDVPWKHAMRLMDCLPAAAASITLLGDGDHRLSRPSDIDLILRLVDRLVHA